MNRTDQLVYRAAMHLCQPDASEKRSVQVSDAVLYSSSDRIGVITLNRPEARNAVKREVAVGLEAAVDRLEDDPEVWVGVLCANTADQDRPVFCAGADLVVATTRSAFGLEEVKHNLIAAAGGLFRLPRAVGQAAAMDAILTGERIDARRAFDVGLVSRLVAPGAAFDEALRVARQIAEARRGDQLPRTPEQDTGVTEPCAASRLSSLTPMQTPAQAHYQV
jgi:enoyl-CoA hydratase/carnithine racemase